MGRSKRQEFLGSTDLTSKRHALYQEAVQHPPGDISYCLKFHRMYIGTNEPTHLREDFCGTALLATTWCKGSVFRSAVGLDIDRPTLEWGMEHNAAAMLGGSAPHQLCLLQCNVLDNPAQASEVPHPCASTADEPSSQAAACSGGESDAEEEEEGEKGASRGPLRSRPCDIVCAFNCGLFLLHKRSELLQYLRNAHAAIVQGRGSSSSGSSGILVADMMGGHAMESEVRLQRTNDTSGLQYTWEQEVFNPMTRLMYAHITLRDPETKQVLKRAFTYQWRIWTIPEVRELMAQAGFKRTHVWIRPMKEVEEESEDEEDSEDSEEGSQEALEADFVEAREVDAALVRRLAKGFTAYVVGVA